MGKSANLARHGYERSTLPAKMVIDVSFIVETLVPPKDYCSRLALQEASESDGEPMLALLVEEVEERTRVYVSQRAV